MAYEVRFHPDVKPQVRKMPKNIGNSLRSKLETVVSVNPVECSEELIGELAGFRSYHFGAYRVIYRILDRHNLIVVVGIGEKNPGHYAEIYKTLEGLARTGKLADSMLTNLKTIGPS